MIKLALFDMDGTIVDSHLDWQLIRNHLHIKPGLTILHDIYQHAAVNEQKLALLESYEQANTLVVAPITGVGKFLEHLADAGIKRALITNNNRVNTNYLLEKYQLPFDLVITRELQLWKPEPDVFFHVMNHYGCRPSETLSIGDSHYDIIASRAAQLAQIYIISSQNGVQPFATDIVYFKDYIHLKEIFLAHHILSSGDSIGSI
jgi:HAD superfamily hydrolase (TIGR01509 family)